MPQVIFILRKVENPYSCLQLRKSPASRRDPRFLLPASPMVAGKCYSSSARIAAVRSEPQGGENSAV